VAVTSIPVKYCVEFAKPSPHPKIAPGEPAYGVTKVGTSEPEGKIGKGITDLGTYILYVRIFRSVVTHFFFLRKLATEILEVGAEFVVAFISQLVPRNKVE